MNEWVKEEPGWYIHETLGGICKEKDGWYVYITKHQDSGFGPFKTLKEAKQYATQRGQKCQD